MPPCCLLCIHNLYHTVHKCSAADRLLTKRRGFFFLFRHFLSVSAVSLRGLVFRLNWYVQPCMRMSSAVAMDRCRLRIGGTRASGAASLILPGHMYFKTSSMVHVVC